MTIYGRPSDRRDSRNRYRYIGVERDEDTGLCMTGPRTYDPTIGRFMQEDRRLPGGFVYCSARPVSCRDRNGRSGSIIITLVGCTGSPAVVYEQDLRAAVPYTALADALVAQGGLTSFVDTSQEVVDKAAEGQLAEGSHAYFVRRPAKELPPLAAPQIYFCAATTDKLAPKTRGGLVAHELTHPRDSTQEGHDWTGEGRAYGFEYYLSRKNSDVSRGKEIEGSRVALGKITDESGRKAFDETYSVLSALDKVISGGDQIPARYKEPDPDPKYTDMDAKTAMALMIELTTSASRSFSPELTKLLDETARSADIDAFLPESQK